MATGGGEMWMRSGCTCPICNDMRANGGKIATQWTAEELEKLKQPGGLVMWPSINKIKPVHFDKPAPQDFVVEQQRMARNGLGRWGWALEQARTAWPRAVWKLHEFDGWIDPKIGIGVKIEGHDLGDYYIPKWRTAFRVRDGATPADIAKMVDSAKSAFCNNVKSCIREAKRKDNGSRTWISLESAILMTGGMVARPAPSTPGECLERAFAQRSPHDSDELHDRLFVGPRAGMEDHRNGW